MQGIAINAAGDFEGSFFDFLNPYGIAVGVLVVTMFTMHGAIFLYLKTEGALQERIHERMWTTFGLFMVVYVLTTIFTLVQMPQATANFETYPVAWLVVVLNVLALANIPRAIYKKRPGQAFLSSCCTILALTALFGFALYPKMVVAENPAHTLDIKNAASSDTTLTIMLIIAIVGMPFVLSYTAAIYWVFRGKVKLGEFSY
jgi:cytochrome d ubiquinol oxidase subunit II